jgi:hypothetical protein
MKLHVYHIYTAELCVVKSRSKHIGHIAQKGGGGRIHPDSCWEISCTSVTWKTEIQMNE